VELPTQPSARLTSSSVKCKFILRNTRDLVVVCELSWLKKDSEGLLLAGPQLRLVTQCRGCLSSDSTKFSKTYSNAAGEDNAYKYKPIIWLAGSASAEFFADIALCPMEMVKVKVQTSPAGTFPTSLGPAVSAMMANKAETRFPFGSVTPLWGRQIPYTMAKFFFFEKVVQLFYRHVFTQPKDTYSKGTQLGITFASGYIAGVICAIVSQAPDNLVSQLAKPANKGKTLGQIASEQGTKKLFTGGLGTRIIMIGTLTGLQWWIYDSFKTAMGMGTTGGK